MNSDQLIEYEMGETCNAHGADEKDIKMEVH
jgi:hypothetical protein